MSSEFKLNLERVFECDAKTLFKAIGEGFLLSCPTAQVDRSNIDFREGGKYELHWGDGPCAGMITTGEFKQVSQFDTIAFTWNVEELKTLVTLFLEEQGSSTKLTLRHEGFTSDKQVEEHTGGWNATFESFLIPDI